ncbi:MAG: sugar ABC transporter permease, partial [Pseudobutyrivibrio sp.]|nr:sugar ABC transporter permease [Pseudobutyrivibrio sp.]
MSFQDIQPISSEWIGFANYAKLLKDNVFHIAVLNSVKYMFFTLVLLIPFPMLFAVLLDSNLVKAKGVWKAILYMPALTSVVISGTLFRLMFTEYTTGQMNVITAALGLGTYKWLKMGWSGMLALLIVACW